METDRIIQPIYHYPIDDYPIEINEFIKPNENGLNEIEGKKICFLLTLGLVAFNSKTTQVMNFAVHPEEFTYELYLLANTGYGSHHFIPNDDVIEKIINTPDIAITDLDRALLGNILMYYFSTVYSAYDNSEKNNKEILSSFVYFFHNAQRYEQRTQRTINIDPKMNAKFIYKVLTDPSFSKVDAKTKKISDEDVRCLSRVLSYRDELIDLVAYSRRKEKEYAMNERNKSDWELFISCINYRSSEEKRVVELIDSDISVIQKIHEFSKYFEEIDIIPPIFNSDISLSELLSRIEDRRLMAPNYMWIKSGNNVVRLDNTTISALSSPYSFNCVLIAYHAFLLKMSPENISRLTFSLNVFIRKNLGQKLISREDFGNLNSLEDCLISTSKLINEFHSTYKDVIESIHYEKIQKDETLSGFSFYDDIWQRVYSNEKKMTIENLKAYNSMDPETEEGFVYRYAELLADNASADEYKNIEKDIKKRLPYEMCDDETELLKREIGNRLIVSINAIYILAKTMERLLLRDFIREEYRAEVLNECKILSKLERRLVQKTYINLDDNLFDDIDMVEYRERKAIDASKVELKNKERAEITLFDAARRNIRILHEEIQNINYEKALEIKSQLREETKDLPDSQLKDFIIELIDQECQDLCNSLIESKSCDADFETIKKQVSEYIGSSFDRLPARTINALTTAELLFSQYSIAENISDSFDYSGISALYYQAVESMYNELIWKDYAEDLYKKRCGDKYFLVLYRDNLLPAEQKIYLPVDGQFKYWDYEKKRVSDHLMMGSFIILLKTITSTTEHPLPGFRKHVDSVFGYKSNVDNADDYESYQKKIDEFYSLLEDAKPRRNAASHGASPINIEECKSDRTLVLSDVESVRKGILGIIKLFLSLYKEKKP